VPIEVAGKTGRANAARGKLWAGARGGGLVDQRRRKTVGDRLKVLKCQMEGKPTAGALTPWAKTLPGVFGAPHNLHRVRRPADKLLRQLRPILDHLFCAG